MYKQQFWSIRQNPYAITNQIQMKNIILQHKFITCPFGHLSDCRNNVINGKYNETDETWKSNSQDRKFIENINIGDIILITFKGIKECIVARIVSEVIYSIDTKLFTNKINDEIVFSTADGQPFRPVGRKIEIINDNLIVNDKRIIPRTSLSHINPNIFNDLNVK